MESKFKILIDTAVKELNMNKLTISSNFTRCINSIGLELKGVVIDEKINIYNSLYKAADGNIIAEIFLKSFALSEFHRESDAVDILTFIIECNELTIYNKYYFYYQITGKIFTSVEMDSDKVFVLKTKLLEKICKGFIDEMGLENSLRQEEELDSNMIVVISSQVLNTNHAPTKTALDRCAVLKKNSNKKVLLINSAECYTLEGILPFYKSYEPGYLEEYNTKQYFEWNDEKIPFFQCEHFMPDVEMMKMILDMIDKLSPICIIAIGGNSILANICACKYRVITVSLYPSSIEPSMGQFITLGRKITEKDISLLNAIGKDRNYIIESSFTYSFKPQTSTISRESIGLSPEDFAIAVIGLRLTEELTDEFLDMLETISTNIKVVLVGGCEDYDNIIARHLSIRDNVINYGFCDDVLALMDSVNLYLNPTRRGGGSSALEALYKGVPVITTRYGDVYTNVGDEFGVTDYNEMRELILKYIEDKKFYKMQSELGKKRASQLLDNYSEFPQIIMDALNRS